MGVVGVLCGGSSSEREVSLNSGTAVYEALISQSIDAKLIDTAQDGAIDLLTSKIDRAMIMLHGRGGEDGAIQGLLKTLDIPYSGSRVSACALAMDKWRSKLIFQGCGVPTPSFSLVRTVEELLTVIVDLGLPLVVKPSREGSTIGITKITRIQDAKAAFDLARKYDATVIAEQFIDGDELTVAVLNGEPLPVVRIVALNNNYDYQAKYHSEETKYFCPSGLDPSIVRNTQNIAMRAFEVLGCSGWGRVDVMLDRAGLPWVLEVNAVPGMTGHSLVPMAALESGLTFEQLVLEILRGCDVA
ncbi:MAG: D-alanine--D-alanine ligase [Proteobacteria bacterium]|nr:D-alanine--D-alanine ligase [Pseudomonadota bacterium]MDA1331092.1 D-alanine--D-alanine ligase [Pseudomonadota bacterium]